jgi:glycosyltransferase involved in cell wall biosynthesis/ribosomal protein S18 acetylase RimI-like enzyme
MKVAHLTTVDLSLRYLVFPQLQATRDLGYETVGISAPGPWVAALESDGIRHIALRSSTRGMNIVADIKSAAELWAILRRERFDILHTHNPKPGLYGRVLGRMAGVPIVVNTVHGLYATPDDPWGKRAVVYSLEMFASRFSDQELVQSEEDVRTMKRLHLAPRTHIEYLGNGVDLEKFTPEVIDVDERRAFRAQIGATDDHVVVGAVGRLVAEKGYLELFQASASLNSDVIVACIGPDDRDKRDALPSSTIEEARSHGVRFLGMRTDVERLYGAMDIFVLPSHREGFPRAAMEAAASGLPVVASDIRGCREVVEHRTNGYLVPVRDPVSLANAINHLASDAELRRAMGQAGRARAIARFDEAKVVDRVLAAYRRAGRRNGHPLAEPIDVEDLTIRVATSGDVDAIARLHSSGIDTGFLPQLGHPFMRRLYRALVGHRDALVLVATDASGPVGFVAGVRDTGEFYREFIRRHGAGAGLVALPKLVRPQVVRRVWESLRYEGADDSGAELLATALLPRARGKGLGTRLGREFLAELGAPEVRVVVGSDNAQAIATYHKMGFVAVDTIEVHAGEQSTVMVWSA